MKNKKHSLFIFVFLFSNFLISQSYFKLTTIEAVNLPKEIKYSGKIITAVEWTDSIDKNLVIVTETGIINGENGDDNKSASLHASHYKFSNNTYIQTWKVNDFVKDCPLDIEANFIPNSFRITDLIQDGTAEIWLMYKTVCHSDVSPSNMKVIMYEGLQKYAMRGRNKVKISETQTEGGEFTFDKIFLEGPKSFRDFAKKLWEKNIFQK